MDFDGTTREWNDTELDEIQGYAMSQQMLDKKWWSASDAIGALRIREVKLRARIEDVDGMAKFMCELSYPATGTGWAGTVESARMAWRERARAVSAYLKEGK